MQFSALLFPRIGSVVEILIQLPARSIARALKTCKVLAALDTDAFWHRVYSAHWGAADGITFQYNINKAVFVVRHACNVTSCQPEYSRSRFVRAAKSPEPPAECDECFDHISMDIRSTVKTHQFTFTDMSRLRFSTLGRIREGLPSFSSPGAATLLFDILERGLFFLDYAGVRVQEKEGRNGADPNNDPNPEKKKESHVVFIIITDGGMATVFRGHRAMVYGSERNHRNFTSWTIEAHSLSASLIQGLGTHFQCHQEDEMAESIVKALCNMPQLFDTMKNGWVRRVVPGSNPLKLFHSLLGYFPIPIRPVAVGPASPPSPLDVDALFAALGLKRQGVVKPDDLLLMLLLTAGCVDYDDWSTAPTSPFDPHNLVTYDGNPSFSENPDGRPGYHIWHFPNNNTTTQPERVTWDSVAPSSSSTSNAVVPPGMASNNSDPSGTLDLLAEQDPDPVPDHPVIQFLVAGIRARS